MQLGTFPSDDIDVGYNCCYLYVLLGVTGRVILSTCVNDNEGDEKVSHLSFSVPGEKGTHDKDPNSVRCITNTVHMKHNSGIKPYQSLELVENIQLRTSYFNNLLKLTVKLVWNTVEEKFTGS